MTGDHAPYLVVEIDATLLASTIEEINDELVRISALPLGSEVFQGLVELVQSTARSVRTLDFDRRSTGALDDLLSLKVPERLVELLAALRAFDGKTEFILEGHALDRSGLNPHEEVAPSALSSIGPDPRGPSTVPTAELGAERTNGEQPR